MSTTDTPRCDAAAYYGHSGIEKVPADFARRLEREVAGATNHATYWLKRCEKAEAEVDRLQGVVAEANASLKAIDELSDVELPALAEALTRAEKAEAALTQSLATGERLREALKLAVTAHECGLGTGDDDGQILMDGSWLTEAKEALASPHAAPAGSTLDSGRDVTDEMAPEIERVVRETHEELERKPAAPAARCPVPAKPVESKVREIADDLVHAIRRGGYGHNLIWEAAVEAAIKVIGPLMAEREKQNKENENTRQ